MKKKDMKEEKEEHVIFSISSTDVVIGLLVYVLTIVAFHLSGHTFSIWATLLAPLWLCVCMIAVAVVRNGKIWA